MKQTRKCVFKSTAASGVNNAELHIVCVEVIHPSYGLYVWPCAPVLAQYVWFNKEQVLNKHVLELGAGTSLPGIVSAKCGALLTLSDAATLPVCLHNCRENCEANSVSATVVGITWGMVTFTLKDLPPVDVILASDCFYDPADFEDLLFTISYIMKVNPAAVCWCTYQERSSDWTIEDKLERWGLKCELIPLTRFEADTCDIGETGLPGNHTIQMLVISRFIR